MSSQDMAPQQLAGNNQQPGQNKDSTNSDHCYKEFVSHSQLQSEKSVYTYSGQCAKRNNCKHSAEDVGYTFNYFTKDQFVFKDKNKINYKTWLRNKANTEIRRHQGTKQKLRWRMKAKNPF
ncbi:hypothetical protein pdam_00000245 [Pocillopora damicornis]|uniref:Uncharacterized protein n=1 Tax=Pocillopora damicornis TaxID=46731 RepID=A0A3M6UXC1_POCDA|nr:hypothetical protein pdam_00000245 [Pocillopora damicornis]